MPQHLPYQTPKTPQDFGRIRWVTLIVGLTSLVLVSSGATQFMAARFFYAQALGLPLGRLFDTPIYAPHKWAVWMLRFSYSQVPYVKQTNALTIGIIFAFSTLVVLSVIYSNFRRSRAMMQGGEDLHGSARFATKDDLTRSGILTMKEGVYIGAFRDDGRDHYLRHNGPEHILAFAPTRSGKGVGIVIPTLLGWTQSTIVYDIKGENWALTSGFRSRSKEEGGLGQTCLKFAPIEDDTAHFNPFELIRFGTDREIADTQNIAGMLLDSGDNPSDRYFLDEAVSLASGLILHLLYEARIKGYRTPSPATLLDIATDPEGPQKVLERIMTFAHRRSIDPPFPGMEDPHATTHPIIAGKMSKMLSKGDKEFGSVIGSLTRPLEIYADPRIRKATAYSDFTIRDLVENPTSLYLIIPPSDKLRLKPLVRAILTITVNRLTEKMDFEAGATKKNPYRLLFLIDEFPQLGNMQEFADALSYMAGYGCKALLITQDVEQLKDPRTYGEHEAITANCHVRIAYAPNTQRTAELLSSMTGKTTIEQQTLSISGTRTSSGQNQMSTTINYVERDLLTPAEVSGLKKPLKTDAGTPKEKIVGPGDMLIFFAGEPPIFGVQILYFLNKAMLSKTQIACPKSNAFTESFPKPLGLASGKRARPTLSSKAMESSEQAIESETIEIEPVTTVVIAEPSDSVLASVVPQFPRPKATGRFTNMLAKLPATDAIPSVAVATDEDESEDYSAVETIEDDLYVPSVEDTELA